MALRISLPRRRTTPAPAAAAPRHAVELATGRPLAFLQFQAGVQQIFAVQVLPGCTFPELIADDPAVIGNSFLLPLG
jgi:hypothetical protein